jgi:hypothetical protein
MHKCCVEFAYRAGPDRRVGPVLGMPGVCERKRASAALAYYRNAERSGFDIDRQATTVARPVVMIHRLYRLED